MNKLYDTKIPQDNLSSVFRLLSNNGVNYFGKNTNCFLDKSMIDKVDLPLRIISDFLLKKDCKIDSFFCGVDSSKDSIKEIWNNIKREEKIIRSDGLYLKKINGETVFFQDKSYRTFWPTLESFLYEYPLSSKKGWLSIHIPATMEQEISIIKSRQDLFNCEISIENINDYNKISFIVDNGEMSFSSINWRRITESLVSVFSISKESVI